MTGKLSYTDRFGNEWSIRAERKRGRSPSVTFTCGQFRLVVTEDDAGDGTVLNPARLKELFCEAERVLTHGDQTWYVGFRKRMGRGGRVQGGVHTRFRSEEGEVRYAKTMVHFRHMSDGALREHLKTAQKAATQ